MRITQSIITAAVQRNISANLARLEALDNQLSSGHRISKPSDDPLGVALTLKYDSVSARNEQYLRDIDDARSWLDTTDQALLSIDEAVQRANELGVAAANGALGPDDRAAIAGEMKELIAHVASTGNTTIGGQYIFSGQQTRTPAFDASTLPPTYNGDDGVILRTIDVGVDAPINVTGDNVILPALTAMTAIYNAVQANDQPALQAARADLDAAHTALATGQATIGAHTNRVEAQRGRLTGAQVAVAQQRSATLDVDMAEASTTYASQSLVYQASLQAGAKMIQPTLLDYLG